MAAASIRFRDLLLLVGAAVAVCVVGVGLAVFVIFRHISPLWFFLPLLSLGFVVGMREEYRKEFRNPRFLGFVAAWVMFVTAVFVLVLATFGWIVVLVVLFFMQALFYLTALWLFGIPIPGVRGEKD